MGGGGAGDGDGIGGCLSILFNYLYDFMLLLVNTRRKSFRFLRGN